MDQELRLAAMAWLDEHRHFGKELFRQEELARFTFGGKRVALMDPQRGTRKPAGMAGALSIRTTYTPPGRTAPYEDAEGVDGLLRYKYRGSNPDHPDNAALRHAFRENEPLIWFVAAATGSYVPVYPVWIVGDEPDQLQFVVAFDVAQRLVSVGNVADADQRAYVERLTRQRLHQPIFRAQVLDAYRHCCAICQLRYVSLLDAAHILPDGHPRGKPVVPNGLALCKIHHAAYDDNLLSVRPDLIVEVRTDVRGARDGPMLLHGIQEMDGVRIAIPAARAARPDPAALQERADAFCAAG